ncbi:hypothetical protein AGMMS50239_17440 [Bacteroidia bacterium]|nr:hypothetical protein AGMMS50239_17440 [Bacteroidia bacterium]
MTSYELNKILSHGEDLHNEFKQAVEKVPPSFYDTVVSFLNREGGTIVLGADDDGNIVGINKNAVEQMKKDIITTLNNKNVINPPVNFPIYPLIENGNTVLCIKIPVSSQIHSHAGIIFDRENDSDIRIEDNARISDLYFRKRSHFTENEIYPYLDETDLDEKLFDKARAFIRSVFKEDDLFRTKIPLVSAVLGKEKAEVFMELVGLDKSRLNNETIFAIESLELAPEYTEIEDLDELFLKKGVSWGGEGSKLKKLRLLINNKLQIDDFKKGWSWSQKGVELFDKRTMTIFKILLFCLSAQTIDNIQFILNFNTRNKLRELYLNPVRDEELLEYTIKDKPNSPRQRYITTEKGRRFLGGFED